MICKLGILVWIALLFIILAIIIYLIAKKWKIPWQSILAVCAFFFSCLSCIITYLRIEIYATNDTFISIIATFIGICTTIIVGLQIYNSIDTKKEIRTVREDYKGKIVSLENTQKKMEAELIKSKEERIKGEIEFKRSICRARGISLSEMQPFTAFIYFIQSLHHSLESNDANLIVLAIKDLQALIGRIEKKVVSNNSIDISHYDKIKNISVNSFRKYHSYPLITSELTQILCEINHIIDEYRKKLP